MAVPPGMFQQNNSLENLFLEYMADEIEAKALINPGVNEFHNAFNNMFGVYVTWPQLQQILKTTAPKEKKLLLRTVFAGMITRGAPGPVNRIAPLSKVQVAELAHKFGVTVDFNQQIAAQQANQPFNPALAAFNFDFLEDTTIHEKELVELKDKIAESILSTPIVNGTQNFDLNPAIKTFELGRQPKQTQAGMFNIIEKVLGNFASIANPLNIGGQNNIFAFFGQLMAQFLSPMMKMLSAFSSAAEVLNQANRTPEMPLDEQDIDKNPSLKSDYDKQRACEFAELSMTLAQAGGSEGASLAKKLNAEWRLHPNSDAVFKKVIDGLVKHAPKEAEAWLIKKEDQYIQDLKEIVEFQKKEDIAKRHGIQQVTTDFDNDLQAYIRGLNKMRWKDLPYASDEYKSKNFNLRYEEYKKYSTDMETIKNKYIEEVKISENLSHVTQEHAMAVQQYNRALPVGVVNPALVQRIADLQQASNDLNNVALNRHAEITAAETHLHGLIQNANHCYNQHINQHNTQNAQKNAKLNRQRATRT